MLRRLLALPVLAALIVLLSGPAAQAQTATPNGSDARLYTLPVGVTCAHSLTGVTPVLQGLYTYVVGNLSSSVVTWNRGPGGTDAGADAANWVAIPAAPGPGNFVTINASYSNAQAWNEPCFYTATLITNQFQLMVFN